VLSLLTVSTGFAADQMYVLNGKHYLVPKSSQDDPTGKKVSNNLIEFIPNNAHEAPSPRGETPASIACIYHLAKFNQPGCPTTGSVPIAGTGWPNVGSGVIAIVDQNGSSNCGYGNYVENDLNTFSETFHLPQCTSESGCFTLTWVGKDTGAEEPECESSSLDEHNLDSQWVHAMAPYAHIIVVESAGDSYEATMAAEDLASQLVSEAGGGQISNSWGTVEMPIETSYDSHFQTPGIVYFFSSGDYSAPARYPSSSPYVVSAGGSSVVRDANGNFIGETAWSTDPTIPIGQKNGGSGGPSAYESRPSYQKFVQNIVGPHRGTPDVAFDSDPQTGVDVYSSYRGQWIIDGGTSAAAPGMAGIVNAAGHHAQSSMEELAMIYQSAIGGSYAANWRNIIVGYNGYPAMHGYNFTTGIGSPLGYNAK